MVIGCAGKGIVGWVESSVAGWAGDDSAAKQPGRGRDVKVLAGNKTLMAEEGVGISQAVDDYMREMEVGNLASFVTCISA